MGKNLLKVYNKHRIAFQGPYFVENFEQLFQRRNYDPALNL